MAFELLNRVNCSGSGVLGTGLAGCKFDINRVIAVGLLTKGYKFTQDPDKDYMRTLQQAGTLIMLQGIVSFTDATADDNIVTRDGSGIKVVAGKNPYEKTAMFDNGLNFHKALTTVSGYEQYDIVLFDVNGSMIVTVAKDGSPKGFTLGMFENQKYGFANGTDSNSQSVLFQMIDRSEFDSNAGWYTTEELDFFPSELTGINEVLVTVAPIVTASTTITVDAYLLDKTHSVDGLLTGDFELTRNGAVLAQTVVQNPTTKKYLFTVTANTTADIVTVRIKNTILTPLDVLYKSNTATAVVTAS